MEMLFAVHFLIRKGLGPEWKYKVIEVGLDDIEPGATETEIKEIAILDAKEQLRHRGLRTTEYIFQTIESA